MPPKTTNTTDGTTDGPTQQEVQFGFECLRNMKDGKVELAGVMAAMSYTNINSVGNCFRKFRSKYGLTGLEATTANAPNPNKRKAAADSINKRKAAADGDSAAPGKRGPGRPPKKPRGKAAKAAAEAAAAAQDNGDGEYGEERKDNLAAEVMKSEEA
ncbi:hypothetical protein BDW69DRAFT_71228 [Aspergillus filifer]